MQGYGIEGGQLDGEVYCLPCFEEIMARSRAEGDDEEASEVCASELRGGTTCGSCGGCWVDGAWESHASATASCDDGGPEWYTCSRCHYTLPTRETPPDECTFCGHAWERRPLNVTVRIYTGNDAFDNPAELARILRDLADQFDNVSPLTLEHIGAEFVYDVNGNKVGRVTFEVE